MDGYTPLAPATLQILISLLDGELHGYAIMQAVSHQSDGQIKIGPGTLYDNLHKLLRIGLVAQAKALDPGDDPRRRYYCLTEKGRAAIDAEVSRLDSLVRAARKTLRKVRQPQCL